MWVKWWQRGPFQGAVAAVWAALQEVETGQGVGWRGGDVFGNGGFGCLLSGNGLAAVAAAGGGGGDGSDRLARPVGDGCGCLYKWVRSLCMLKWEVRGGAGVRAVCSAGEHEMGALTVCLPLPPKPCHWQEILG